MLKIDLSNLAALVQGREMTLYQRSLAVQEFDSVVDLLKGIELKEKENGESTGISGLNLCSVTARTLNVGDKATWRGMELFVAEVGNNEVLLATDMNVDADDYNDWWVANLYVR